MKSAHITVYGIPAPQGSKRHVGRGIMIESSKKVKPWREAVKWAIFEKLGPDFETISGPVVVSIEFQLPKPKSSPKKRLHPDSKPDIDKLIRSTLDAITESSVIEDDARVVRLQSSKVFCGAGDKPGASIKVESMADVKEL